MMTAQETERDWSVHALIIALCLHAAVLFLFPYLNQEPLAFPVRVEVEMASMTRPVEKPAETPPPQPVPVQVKPEQPTKPEPKPVVAEKQPEPKQPEVAQQVLTAPPDAEPAQPDYVVPETPTPAATPPPTPPPAATATNPIAPVITTTPAITVVPAVAREETTETSDSNEVWENYGQLIFDMVSRHKNYPQMAIRRNWQGRAKVSAQLDRGRLVDISLLESSGLQVLDDEALGMVKKAIAEISMKDSLAKKTFTLVVPVDFALEK